MYYYHLGKGGYVFGSVGLSVCVFVCGQNEWITKKFYEGALGNTMKNWLNCGGDLGILRWVQKQKTP